MDSGDQGLPTFIAPPYADVARDVDEIVEARYGRQPSGSPHNWRGDRTDDGRVRITVLTAGRRGE